MAWGCQAQPLRLQPAACEVGGWSLAGGTLAPTLPLVPLLPAGSCVPRAPGADTVPAGECCLALRSAIGSTAQQFETFLFHRGGETGSVRGWMRVRVPRGRSGTRERLYGNGGRPQPLPVPWARGHPLGSGTPWATSPSVSRPWGEARPRCLCRVDQL